MMQCTGMMWMAMQQSLTTSSAQAQHGGRTQGATTQIYTRRRIVGQTQPPNSFVHTRVSSAEAYSTKLPDTNTHLPKKVPATTSHPRQSVHSHAHSGKPCVPLPPLQQPLHTQIQGTRLWKGRHNHMFTHLLHSFLQRRTAGTAATCLLPRRTGRFTTHQHST